MTAQLIDDVEGKTLLSVSTLDKRLRDNFSAKGGSASGRKHKGNITASRALGELLAKEAQKANMKQVKFDKSGYRYHGRVKEFAEACRKNGLQF